VKLTRLAILPVLVALLFANQTWITVKLIAAKNVEMSGSESLPAVSALVVVAALALLLGLYLKYKASVAFYGLSLICLGASLYLSLAFIINHDASAASTPIAKATGIQGWESQLQSVVSAWNITATPEFFSITVLIAMILIGSLFMQSAVKNATKKQQVVAKKAQVLDLWSETSK